MTIHIHEDDSGMRNLYPLDALPEASADVEQAREAGERNRAPDGIGWTDVHLIKPPSKDYSAVGLRLETLHSALDGSMPRVSKFVSSASAGFDPRTEDPYGTRETDAHCYGFDGDCFLKIEPAGEYVKGIWFECRTSDDERRNALRRAIEMIDSLAPSAIADYWNDMSGPVGDPRFLDDYFSELAIEEPDGEA